MSDALISGPVKIKIRFPGGAFVLEGQVHFSDLAHAYVIDFGQGAAAFLPGRETRVENQGAVTLVEYELITISENPKK